MSEMTIKYRHPEEPSLAWSGKGRQPKWVEAALQMGFTLEQLDVANQDQGEIDLGIGVKSAPVRPVSGVVLDVETENQNARLAELSEAYSAPVVPMQVEAGQQQLEACLVEFGFQAMTVQEFIQVGVEEFNHATIRACRAGVAFWAAQEAVKNTECASGALEFKDWIADAGLTKERVYECIRIAKFYSRLPQESRAKALSIGKKQALLLAALPPEVIEQAAESGNDLLEKADMMTVSELKQEIKDAQRREKNYDAEIERLTLQVKKLSQDKVRTTTLLQRTEELREECMALQLGAELSLNALRKLFDETEQAGPEGKLQVDHLWIAVNAVAARALDVMEYIRARSLDALPDRPMGEHMLTQEEAERWLLDYPLIENRFAAERALRQEKRDAAKPRGPGRPKGSGKAGE